jgi:hypothetical protein
VRLSPREHTISGINQFHITHSSGLQRLVFTRLGMQSNTNQKPRLGRSEVDDVVNQSV